MSLPAAKKAVQGRVMREMWRHGIGCSLMESKVRQQPQRNDLRRRMGRMGRKLRKEP